MLYLDNKFLHIALLQLEDIYVCFASVEFCFAYFSYPNTIVKIIVRGAGGVLWYCAPAKCHWLKVLYLQ